MVLPPGRRRRPLPELFFVLDPVVGVGVGRVDHFGDDLIVGLDDENGTRVFVFPAIVSSRKHSYQLTLREALETVHHTLMGPDYHVQIVLLEETLHPVRTELHDVPRLRWVAQVVGVNPQLAV